MHIDPAAGGPKLFCAIYAIGSVDFPCLCHVLGHGPEPLWTIYLEWLFATHDPWSKNQVGITGRVVRVQMRQENSCQFDAPEPECSYAFPISGRNSPNDTRAKIDEGWSVVDDDGGCWARAVRVGAGRSGPEHDNFGRWIGFPRCLHAITFALATLFEIISAGALHRLGRAPPTERAAHRGGR